MNLPITSEREEALTFVVLTMKQAEEIFAALDIGLGAATQEAAEYHEAMKGYRPAQHKALDDDAASVNAALTLLGQLMEDARGDINDSGPTDTESARTTVETTAFIVQHRPTPVYDITALEPHHTEPGEEQQALAAIARAVTYLEARGLLRRPVDGAPNLVSFA
jgi:hypothetical protein